MQEQSRNLQAAVVVGLVSLCCTSSCSKIVFDPAASHEIPPFEVPPLIPQTSYEHFLVIGDMGSGGAGQRAVASAMARRARATPIDFVLTVGDNFYPDGVLSVQDPQWQTTFERIYHHDSLQVPFYATLGNHDHKGDPQAQVLYSQHSGRWRMPAQYYTFVRRLADGTAVAFFALDTNPIARELPEAAEQLAWLDRELAACAARWKIVYGHHPLYGHNPDRGHNERMIEQVEPLLTGHQVDLYLAGHDHALEMIKPIDGVHYVISGGGAGPSRAYEVDWTAESFYAATLGGFTMCRVSRGELVIEFVRMDGDTEYAHVLPK